eukprot:490097-Rhodomonas_salina.8
MRGSETGRQSDRDRDRDRDKIQRRETETETETAVEQAAGETDAVRRETKINVCGAGVSAALWASSTQRHRRGVQVCCHSRRARIQLRRHACEYGGADSRIGRALGERTLAVVAKELSEVEIKPALLHGDLWIGNTGLTPPERANEGADERARDADAYAHTHTRTHAHTHADGRTYRCTCAHIQR